MKKTIQLLFSLLIFASAFAQEKRDSLQIKKENKWSIGVLGGMTTSTGYSYGFFTGNKWGSKYALGINIKKKIFKKGNLVGGVSYNVLEHLWEANGRTWASPFYRGDIYHYELCTIPFLYEMGFGKNNLSYYLGVGPKLNVVIKSMINSRGFYTDTNNTIIEYDTTYYSINGIKNNMFIFSFDFNAGVKYSLKNRFTLFLQGDAIYAQKKIQVTPPPVTGSGLIDQTFYLKYFMVSIGISHKFNSK